MHAVRRAAVAGLFYPASAEELRRMVEQQLVAAGHDAQMERPAPKLLIVPHAGYIYSGEVAARAYALLVRPRASIRRVVLLGPAHRVEVRGLAAPETDAFETPMGPVAIDRGALDQLADLHQVALDDHPHAPEHSLEVQLPFLQKLLPDFALVPLLVGCAGAQAVAQVLERLWGDEHTVIVISSDLSHYLPYAQARSLDRATARRILALDTSLSSQEACGAAAINGALLAAQHHGLVPRLVDLRSSGDTAGDRSRVVGYGAFEFT